MSECSMCGVGLNLKGHGKGGDCDSDCDVEWFDIVAVIDPAADTVRTQAHDVMRPIDHIRFESWSGEFNEVVGIVFDQNFPNVQQVAVGKPENARGKKADHPMEGSLKSDSDKPVPITWASTLDCDTYRKCGISTLKLDCPVFSHEDVMELPLGLMLNTAVAEAMTDNDADTVPDLPIALTNESVMVKLSIGIKTIDRARFEKCRKENNGDCN